MLTTITLNPSIDRRYVVDHFQVGNVFRPKHFEATAGGKGLNVARVAQQLGESVLTSGFLGEKNGDFILEELQNKGIHNEFVSIEGQTRNCIAILSENGVQTELLEPGPIVTNDEMEQFLQQYEQILVQSSIIVASGSLPRGIPDDFYYQLIKKAKAKGVKFLLDTSGTPLKEAIKAAPFLIKPNKSELETLMNCEIKTDEELIYHSFKISRNGIPFVVVSLGSEGAIVIYNEKGYRVKIPKIAAINPVGSGDSMVAGFAVGLNRNDPIEDIIKLGVACGTANALEMGTGQIDLDKVSEILNYIQIEETKI
ncbi:1-phosphofructokinase [Tepidibacillus marianensis]|uniref:1-phosphofructokinase n=1 Tax=Tepidibacillus marianensis TaxID=3131995 RepID=UPI0030D305D5